MSEDFAELAELVERARADAERDAERAQDPDVIAGRRRRRRRRAIVSGVVAFVAMLAVGAYIVAALTVPLGTTSAVVAVLPDAQGAVAEITLPEYGASAVSVTGAENYAGTLGQDGILASRDLDVSRPMASISKIVTSLVVLDAKPLGATDAGPTIRFSKADHALYDKYYLLGATIQPMPTGSTVTLREALQLMLVVSASNYAEAVSTWAFGSQAAFVSATAAWLSEHGLSGTTMVEPTGIDPRNASTPRDLVAIGTLALAHPVISQLVRYSVLSVPGFRQQSSTNLFLGVDGIDGIKTGTLAEAGSCLLFSATASVGIGHPITIVGVVLGQPGTDVAGTAATRIIDSIKAGFQRVSLVAAGDRFATYTTLWGEEVHAIAAQSAATTGWSDFTATATAEAESIALAPEGTVVGGLEFSTETNEFSVGLVLDDSVTGPDAWWRITHPAEVFGWGG
jgi:D-alanyl-D-alanine carboxypeptidase (penicillin-binding protein 5/6)